MKEDYQKALKKLTLFFLSKPVPFKGQNYQKQKGSETNDQSLRLRNKFRNIPLFIIYYLTKLDNVLKSSFSVIPKITSANLCKSVDEIINYSTSICPFESGNCGKEGKKLQTFEYLENKKSFLDEIKNIFHSFQRVSFGENIKI